MRMMTRRPILLVVILAIVIIASIAGNIVLSEAERAVKVFGNPDSNEGAAIIITLRGKQIHKVNAGSLGYALAFEAAWVKLP